MMERASRAYWSAWLMISSILVFSCAARSAMTSMVVLPIFRAGSLMMRRRRTSSRALATMDI